MFFSWKFIHERNLWKIVWQSFYFVICGSERFSLRKRSQNLNRNWSLVVGILTVWYSPLKEKYKLKVISVIHKSKFNRQGFMIFPSWFIDWSSRQFTWRYLLISLTSVWLSTDPSCTKSGIIRVALAINECSEAICAQLWQGLCLVRMNGDVSLSEVMKDPGSHVVFGRVGPSRITWKPAWYWVPYYLSSFSSLECWEGHSYLKTLSCWRNIWMAGTQFMRVLDDIFGENFFILSFLNYFQALLRLWQGRKETVRGFGELLLIARDAPVVQLNLGVTFCDLLMQLKLNIRDS